MVRTLDLDKKPPSKVDIGLAKFTGVGERMQGGRSGHTVKAGDLQSRRDTIIDAKRCPQCGSSSYDERKVKMPKLSSPTSCLVASSVSARGVLRSGMPADLAERCGPIALRCPRGRGGRVQRWMGRCAPSTRRRETATAWMANVSEVGTAALRDRGRVLTVRHQAAPNPAGRTLILNPGQLHPSSGLDGQAPGLANALGGSPSCD